MKKRLGTSVIASTVLVAVLGLSGCGGSSNENGSSSLPTVSNSDPIASGNSGVVASVDGSVKDVKVSLITKNSKDTVAVATIKSVKCVTTSPCCTNVSDGCNIAVEQVSICGAKSAGVSQETVDADIAEARTHTQELIDAAAADGRYDDNTDMIVFGGTTTFTTSGFDSATVSLSVNMLSCGAAFLRDGGAKSGVGFANEGHIVDVYVKAPDGTGKWINNVKINDGKILLSSDQLGDIKDGSKLFFYSIKPENDKPGTTGMSGAS